MAVVSEYTTQMPFMLTDIQTAIAAAGIPNI